MKVDKDRAEREMAIIKKAVAENKAQPLYQLAHQYRDSKTWEYGLSLAQMAERIRREHPSGNIIIVNV